MLCRVRSTNKRVAITARDGHIPGLLNGVGLPMRSDTPKSAGVMSSEANPNSCNARTIRVPFLLDGRTKQSTTSAEARVSVQCDRMAANDQEVNVVRAEQLEQLAQIRVYSLHGPPGTTRRDQARDRAAPAESSPAADRDRPPRHRPATRRFSVRVPCTKHSGCGNAANIGNTGPTPIDAGFTHPGSLPPAVVCDQPPAA